MTNPDAATTPPATTAVAEVSSLFIYPVKSCRRVEVELVSLSTDGLGGVTSTLVGTRGALAYTCDVGQWCP